MSRLTAIGIALGIAIPVSTTAQSILQDDKGRTAFIVPQGGFVSLNSAEGSAELAYFHLVSSKALLTGLSFKAKSTDGLAALLGGGKVKPSASALGQLGYKTDAFLVALTYQREWQEATVIDSTIQKVTPAKVTQFTWEGGVRVRFSPNGRNMVGVAVGRRKVSSLNSLPKATYHTIREFTDTVSGVVSQTVQTKEIRIGPPKAERLTFLDVDWLMLPRQGVPMSFRVFGRGLLERDMKSPERNSLGFDVGVHKRNGDPISDRLVAMIFQLNEVRPGDKTTDLSARLSIGFMANLAPVLGTLADVIK